MQQLPGTVSIVMLRDDADGDRPGEAVVKDEDEGGRKLAKLNFRS